MPAPTSAAEHPDRFDQEPQREVLIKLLNGRVVVHGSDAQPALDALAAEGMLVVRLRGESWVCSPTAQGHAVGVVLAQSRELVHALEVFSGSRELWTGAPISSIMGELFRRAGHDTDEGAEAWVATQDRSQLAGLPRLIDAGAHARRAAGE